jgi:hypothetical protein
MLAFIKRRGGNCMKKLGAVAVAVFAVLLGAGPASAGELLRKDVSVPSAVDRSCTAGKLSIFKAENSQVVAGSASRGARELAAGYAIAGQKLVVQACRLSGGASSAGLSIQYSPIDTTKVAVEKLVKVSTPSAARKNVLNGLGLDVTEHGGEGFVDVVLHGAADATKLAANNFSYTVAVPNLALQARNDRKADLAYAAATTTSGMPSGRTTYRRLFDYQEDMKRLANEHPDLVRAITLNHQTY